MMKNHSLYPTPQSGPPEAVTVNPFSRAFPQSSIFPGNIPALLFPHSSAVNTDFPPTGEFLCHHCLSPPAHTLHPPLSFYPHVDPRPLCHRTL